MPTLERQEVSAPSWGTCLRLSFPDLLSPKRSPLLVRLFDTYSVFQMANTPDKMAQVTEGRTR